MNSIKKKIIITAILCSMSITILSGCTLNENTVNVSETSAVSETTSETTAVAEEVIVEAPVPSVSFSHKAGVYGEAFSLELSALEDGEIYYTTDGSDPALSDTAVVYSAPLSIADRSGDANVVSAVDPDLFSANFSVVNETKNGFTNKISAPSDDAVDKCTVIRAAVKRADGTFAGEQFSTYFIGTHEEHIQGLKESCEASGNPLAVVSITMNYDDLFDNDKGIYVKGTEFKRALAKESLKGAIKDGEAARALNANYKQKGREWERKAAVTMFEFTENGAEPVIEQNCGIRIQGNYSRSDLQKGFRLYARREYGNNNFDYTVFGEEYTNVNGEIMDKYDTLVLRNGGNYAFSAKFNDTFWQSLIGEMDCSTQKSRPCVVYLNGEYWGLYVLQEDYTNDYMEDYYGVNKDDVVIYKGDAEALKLGYKLDEGDLPEGVTDERYYFNDLLNFFKTHRNLKSDDDYNEFSKLVDPQSVMDYFAVQCWIDNKWDWPGKNWSMWKTTTSDSSNEYGDGRWRLMFYDIEFGGCLGKGDIKNNTLKNANYKPNGLLDMDTENPAVLCFAYLMTNDDFRTEFCKKLTSLSDGCFETKTAQARLAEFTAEYSPLYEQFFKRYEGAGDIDDAAESITNISDFLDERKNYIQKMIDFCDKVLGKIE